MPVPAGRGRWEESVGDPRRARGPARASGGAGYAGSGTAFRGAPTAFGMISLPSSRA
jgi:hypothetical protein